MIRGAAIVAACAAMWAGASAQEGQNGVPLLEQSAAAYIHMRSDLDYADKTTLNSAKVTRTIHDMLGSHDPKKVSAGHMAYAALVAADTPAFADALERRANKPKKREKFLADLRNNPAMIRDMDGVDAAIAAILTVSERDASRIGQAGERYIADAYKLQNSGWARAKLAANGTARLNKSRAYASGRQWPAYGARPAVVSKSGNRRPNLDAEPGWSRGWSDAPAGRQVDLDQARQVYLTKTLVLAARYALDDLNEGHIEAFGTDKASERCYKIAKLNLDQCISATRTPVEETFCLGTHGLNDISRCVGWLTGGGTPKG